MDQNWKVLTDILSHEEESSILNFNDENHTNINVIEDTVLHFTLNRSPPSEVAFLNILLLPPMIDTGR